MNKYDVIVVGAGACGLMAAKTISTAKQKVCLLEARDRIGGRAYTITGKGFSKPVEAGAEFIHGNLELTISLLKKAGIKYYETDGELWQLKDNDFIKREDFIVHADDLMKKMKLLKQDISIAAFLEEHFAEEKYVDMKRSLQQYMEGYDAADINFASTLALKEEWEKEQDVQFRIEYGGYGRLLNFIKIESEQNGCNIELSSVVKIIKWREGYAEVVTSDNRSFAARKIITTVPLLFLNGEENQAGISFEPQLPVITEAVKQIGYCGVIKVVLEFTHPFWETGESRKAKDLFFLFSEQKIPTWWTQLPDKTPVLVGWLAGPKANKFVTADDEEILHQSLESLSNIFDIEKQTLLKYLKASLVHNWTADPFTLCAYSYNTTTSSAAKAILSQPVSNTLFFSGEALNKESNATVDAALQSGKEVAEKVLNSDN